jgi:hypothetical protein
MKNWFIICSLLFVLVLGSCKDKEMKVDKCTNGFLDAGEEAVDCGGKCKPCETNQTPYMFVRVNGNPIQVQEKGLNYSNQNWLVYGVNDSLSFQLNLGSNASIGNYEINSSQSGGVFGTSTMTFLSGLISVSYHDSEKKIMSGFFLLK